jgi:hypothetical protein
MGLGGAIDFAERRLFSGTVVSRSSERLPGRGAHRKRGQLGST